MIQKVKNLKLIYLLSLMVLIYMVLRFFFYLLHKSYFSDVSFNDLFFIFKGGLVFDLSAIFLLNSFFIVFSFIPFKFTEKKLYNKFLIVLFLLLNLPALFFAFTDLVYFKFINTRTTAEVFKYVTISNDVVRLIPQFLKDFWYILFLFLGCVYLMFYFVKRIILSETPALKGTQFYVSNIFLLFFWSFISIIAMRGGFQLRPINLASAYKYAEAKHIPLVLNTPFNIIKTFNKEPIIPFNYFDKNTCDSIYNPISNYYLNNKKSSKKNIVIFILEGFSKEHIGALNKNMSGGGYKGYTPFLDSIMSHAIVFENAFANGKRSIDATSAILAGIPNLMHTAFILSPYAANRIESIAYHAKKLGYTSAFFHGGTNGTMGFDNFARLASFDTYFGRTEYNNEKDFDGKWGIYDEPFFQRMAIEIDNYQEPFLSVMFSLSSHHPYKIPNAYENVFPKGDLPIHESIGYADFALRRFFETISKTEWFRNTIFIFTADHTSDAFYPKYKTKVGNYAVPLIIFDPDSDTSYTVSDIVQHTDIMPTVLDLINYNEDFLAFGKSVFDARGASFSVNFSDNLYQFIKDDYVYLFTGAYTIEIYNFKNDTLLENNLRDYFDATKLWQAETLLKAYIQNYQYRMLNNKLRVE